MSYPETYNQTWQLVVEDPTIRSIQEPICEQYVDIQDFHEAYRGFLITLDGRDCMSFVDFFWQRSPTNSTCLEFVDGDARMDMYDLLRDEGLVPEMDQVHSGDWKFKKKTKTNTNTKHKIEKAKNVNDGDCIEFCYSVSPPSSSRQTTIGV